MSLVKSPELTPEKLAANQANGRQSQGPATAEGVERIRAASARHGYYSKAPGAEMHVLDAEYNGQRSELEVTSAWRDSMMAPRHPQAGALVHKSNADFRQLCFLTDLLIKHQARGKKRGSGEDKAA
jgi:hypothetical protein